MPIDPYTGELLPYGPYDGPWPPPEWGAESPGVMPDAPPVAESPVPAVALAPEAEQARAAADALFTEQKPRVDVAMGDAIVEPEGQFDVEMGSVVLEPEAPPIEPQPLPDVFEPDAVSGGEVAPLEAPAPALLTNPKNREQAEKEAERDRIAGLSADELQLEQFDSDMAAQAQADQQAAVALQEKHQAAREAEEAYRSAMERAAQERAAIDAERDRLANEKVDPDGWRNSRNLFQTISMYVAGIVGGLVQSRTGSSTNMGLQMIDRAIASHMEAQRENLANRRAMLGERRASLADTEALAANELRQAQAFYEASYLRAAADIEADKQQFDPLGTAYRKREMLQRQLMARAAQARAEAYQQLEDREIKRGKFDLEVSAENRALRKQALDERKAAAAASGAAAAKVKHPPEYFVALYGIDPRDAPKIPMTEKDFASYLARKGNVAELASKQATETRTAEKTKAEGTVFDPLTGDPVGTSANVTQAAKAQEALTASAGALKNIDTIIRLADKADGASDLVKSAEWQEITANKEIVKQQIRKAFEMGTLDASAAESIDKILGGVDPTSFIRDAAPGLRAARRAMQSQVNDRLKGAGIKQEWKVPDMSAPPKAKPDKDIDTLAGIGVRTKGGFSAEPTLDENQSLALKSLVERAGKGDEKAIEGLAQNARNPNPAVRDAAAAALVDLARGGNEKAAAKVQEAMKAAQTLGEGE